MQHWIARQLDSVTTVYAACAVTLVLGLVFVFVWAPHPWTWQGIDQYHELARALARGEPFGTTDVPWGYAYFVAAFYAAFGEHPWLPVTAQVFINALLPLLLYWLVRPLSDQRTAVLSAVLTGVLSFNTVYASTQSTDSVCTVLFILALLAFSRGVREQQSRWFAASGLLLGIVPQFRPNLILLGPLIAALYVMWPPRSTRSTGHAVLVVVCMSLVLMPWIVRNYRLTGQFLPTSTHGAVQLWYGTLQVGPYLENRAANPRSAFESAAFPYTSIAGQPLVVQARGASCERWHDAEVRLVFWTDRSRAPRRLSPLERADKAFDFEIPAQPSPTVVYYYLEATWPGNERAFTTPVRGADEPWVYFVSDAHLADLDVHHDLLDIFDIIRLTRTAAWSEPIGDQRLDFNADGRFDEIDVAAAVRALLGDIYDDGAAAVRLDVHDDRAVLRLSDGSSLELPRLWSARVTDATASPGVARTLVYTRRSWVEVEEGVLRPAFGEGCRLFETVTINDVFYRSEVHMMRRYSALALDNIRRDPLAFVAASAYRMLRLFVVRGSDDRDAVQQFESSRLVYSAATLASAAYLALFLTGVVVALRRRQPLLLLLIPILYVPLTICWVLTNMRYTITMQPLVFAFIATALASYLRKIWNDTEPFGSSISRTY
jgi:hypothetical protein